VNLIVLCCLADDLVMLATSMSDFKSAIQNVKKSVSSEDLKKYEDWMKEYGSI
jgi:SpoVK/Ycf46/Vps4 family AAA+-type ATPase